MVTEKGLNKYLKQGHNFINNSLLAFPCNLYRDDACFYVRLDEFVLSFDVLEGRKSILFVSPKKMSRRKCGYFETV